MVVVVVVSTGGGAASWSWWWSPRLFRRHQPGRRHRKVVHRFNRDRDGRNARPVGGRGRVGPTLGRVDTHQTEDADGDGKSPSR